MSARFRAQSIQSLLIQAVAAILIAVLLFFQYLLWIAGDGIPQTRALKIALQVQREENMALNERNRGLAADIEDLKTGLMAIEERARSEMGMIRQGETFYRILNEPVPVLKKRRKSRRSR